MMIKTSSGQKVAHGGIRTTEWSTEYGFTRRLMGAVASVQEILLAVSRRRDRSSSAHRQDGRPHCDERNSSKIRMHLKNGFYATQSSCE